MDSLDILRQDRALIARTVVDLTDTQLRTIPPGHKNNILWNLGHIVVVQQLLHYRLSGLDVHVPAEMIEQVKSGTSPADWSSPPDADQIHSLLVELPEKLAADYRAGRFAGFQEYTTSRGIRLCTIDDAIAFNHFHEGIHMGIIMSLRKRVA